MSEAPLRKSAANGITLVTLVVGAPFALANALQGYPVVAMTAAAATVLLVCHALAIGRAPGVVRFTQPLIVVAGLLFLTSTVHARGNLGLLWTYPVLIGFYGLLGRRSAWVANLALLLTVLPVAYLTLELTLVIRAAATLLTISAFAAVMMDVIHRYHSTLLEQIQTDPLTGVLNRQSLQSTLERAREDATARGGDATLLAMDIDNFKQINDEGGHAIGDRVLRLLGASLKSWVRAEDAVFRIGGDEFLVVLAGVSADVAFAPADALRQAVQKDASGAGVEVTFSGGLATLTAGQSTEDWQRAADAALYKAKSAGRNRLVMALEPPAATAPMTAPATAPVVAPVVGPPALMEATTAVIPGRTAGVVPDTVSPAPLGVAR